jgi:hypothetical protein
VENLRRGHYDSPRTVDPRSCPHRIRRTRPLHLKPAASPTIRGSPPIRSINAQCRFGRFSNDLLVGSFGDGTIHAFNPTTARLLGTLTTSDHRQLVIRACKHLRLGDASAGGPNAVWFSAGPNGGQHGLLGT